MVGFGELFLSKGFSVLLPDSRGEGESGGRFPTYGIKETDDVHRWFDWLAAQKHPRCIFGMGESMGAAILLQSVREETRFCAVVAESPFASFRQISIEKRYAEVCPEIGLGNAVKKRSPFKLFGWEFHSEEKIDIFYGVIGLMLVVMS